MEEKNSFESLLQAVISPIIHYAVRTAMAAYCPPINESRESMPDLMDVKLTSALLHLSVPTIYGLVYKRSIPYYKRGQRLYFRRDDIEHWVNAGRRLTVDEIREAARESLVRRRRK